MDFERLRTFIAVVETGSFKQAAKQEYISQRAISQSMSKLETELGIRLFDRGKNRIQITPAGQRFYLKTKDLLKNFDIEVQSLRNTQNNQQQELRIGYFSPFEGQLLRHQLFNCQLHNSNWNFIVNEESIEHLLSDVALGILDLAYVLDYGNRDVFNNDVLVFNSIYEDQMVMGISKLNPASQKPSLPLSILKTLPILYYSPEYSNYLKRCFTTSLTGQVSNLQLAHVASLEQMQTIVSLNQALAYYPRGLVEKTLPASPCIVYRPLDLKADQQAYRIMAVYRKNSEKQQLIHQFLNSIK